MEERYKSLMLTVGMLFLILIFSFAIKYSFLYLCESVDYDVNGVDVSLYQGNIKWRNLEREGIDFAFIKATEGSSYVDENFDDNWKMAGRTSMSVSAYHFLSYDSDGKSQADNYINTVKSRWDMMPPSIDVEFYGEYESKKPSGNKLRKILNDYIAEIEHFYGMKPIIYTNKYIYKKYISGHYDDYRIWISDLDKSEHLPDGRDWTFCQYSFDGHFRSIDSGNISVDLNVFNGSKWDLRWLKFL